MSAPLIRTTIETAEMVKYADNVWHALKVGFANEIGNLCKALRIDSHKVMEIFCQDTKLNLSPYYLKPGFAFGGSCLPKDVRALTYKGKSLDVALPILERHPAEQPAAGAARRRHGAGQGPPARRRAGLQLQGRHRRPARKPGGRARSSALIGKGYDLRIYDKNVNMAALTGANRDYILNHIPHISRLMVGAAAEVMDFAEVVVIGNGAAGVPRAGGRTPARARSWSTWCASPTSKSVEGSYDGICW